VLIGLGGAAAMFPRKDVEMTSSRIVGSDDDTPSQEAAKPPSEPTADKKDEDKQKEKKEDAAQKPDEKKKPAQPIAVPGSAFRAKVNRDHFLSFGYESDTIVAFLGGDIFFRASKDGSNVVTFATEGQLTVSGFVWPDNTEGLLRGSAYLIDEPTGAGHVIMFADDPNLRFLWRSTTQLFLNAILLAPSLR